jgi:hypothetical protein
MWKILTDPHSILLKDSMFMGESGEIQTLVKWGKGKNKKRGPKFKPEEQNPEWSQRDHKGTENRLFLKGHSCKHNEAMVATDQNHTNQP